MCEALDLRIRPRRDRPPPFWNSWIHPLLLSREENSGLKWAFPIEFVRWKLWDFYIYVFFPRTPIMSIFTKLGTNIFSVMEVLVPISALKLAWYKVSNLLGKALQMSLIDIFCLLACQLNMKMFKVTSHISSWLLKFIAEKTRNQREIGDILVSYRR